MEHLIPKEERLVRSLSWSKVWSWSKSQKQFMKTYFEKAPFFETKEIIFGSTLGNMIELGEYHDIDYIKDKVMTNFQGEIEIDMRKEKIILQSIDNIQKNIEFVSKLEEMSFDFGSEMEIKMDSFIDGVYLIGFADNGTSDWKTIKEFKTGKTAWTQDKVDNHGQLDFYCLMTYLTKGYLPDDVELTWFETKDDGSGGITPTGKIQTFKFDVEKHKERILGWEQKIPKIFLDIQKAQIKWAGSKEVENKDGFDNIKLMELADINNKIKKLSEKKAELQKEVEQEMIDNNLQDYKIEGLGSVFYTTRKSWKYSDEIKTAEKEFKAKKKAFEEANDPTEKTSISFRLS